MIARGFRSVVWVAAVGGAALGCYMLSLQVATERADLARVERQIVATKQQIRALQTELGTRGRLSQLEQWNADVLALSAPATGQFLQNELLLARLDMNDQTVAERVPVRMASADTGGAPAQTEAGSPAARPQLAVEPAPPAAVQPALVHRTAYSTLPNQQAARPAPAAAKPAASAAKPGSSKPARRLDAGLVEEIGAAARDEKAARPPVARPDTSRNSAEPRDEASPVRSARADSARPRAGSARADKPADKSAKPATPRSAAGSAGNR